LFEDGSICRYWSLISYCKQSKGKEKRWDCGKIRKEENVSLSCKGRRKSLKNRKRKKGNSQIFAKRNFCLLWLTFFPMHKLKNTILSYRLFILLSLCYIQWWA
jgi:hypothetical protein